MTIALVLSGGSGTRLGTKIPKQYVKVGGKTIFSYAMQQLVKQKEIDAIQIVAEEFWQDRILEECTSEIFLNKFRGFSKPGENRQMSIFHGLEDIKNYAEEEDVILIHDAARPLVSEKIILGCLTAVKEHEGVMPVLPMKDTIYYSENGSSISKLADRSQLFAGQAPECFRFGKYYEANRRLLPEKILLVNGSTEPAVMAGMDIVMIPGEEQNFKITTKADLERFKRIVEEL